MAVGVEEMAMKKTGITTNDLFTNEPYIAEPGLLIFAQLGLMLVLLQVRATEITSAWIPQPSLNLVGVVHRLEAVKIVPLSWAHGTSGANRGLALVSLL